MPVHGCTQPTAPGRRVGHAPAVRVLLVRLELRLRQRTLRRHQFGDVVKGDDAPDGGAGIVLQGRRHDAILAAARCVPGASVGRAHGRDDRQQRRRQTASDRAFGNPQTGTERRRVVFEQPLLRIEHEHGVANFLQHAGARHRHDVEEAKAQQSKRDDDRGQAIAKRHEIEMREWGDAGQLQGNRERGQGAAGQDDARLAAPQISAVTNISVQL